MKCGGRDIEVKEMNMVRLFLSAGGALNLTSGIYFLTVPNIIAKIYGGVCCLVGILFLLSGLTPEPREESL